MEQYVLTILKNVLAQVSAYTDTNELITNVLKISQNQFAKQLVKLAAKLLPLTYKTKSYESNNICLSKIVLSKDRTKNVEKKDVHSLTRKRGCDEPEVKNLKELV